MSVKCVEWTQNIYDNSLHTYNIKKVFPFLLQNEIKFSFHKTAFSFEKLENRIMEKWFL